MRAFPPSQAPTTSPIYHRTFVGRENELRQLRAAFDGAVSGQSSLVMVVGEPGIGKTAVCEQLATHVAVRGGKTLVGHCYEEGSLSLPYLAFVEAMRTYVLDRDPEGLRSDLGSGVEEVSRIVSEIRHRLSLSQDSALSTQHSLDPDEERWRLFQAVTGFLRNASSVQPLVIVLEDLHWADRGTLELLVHLARNLQAARLLLVGTYRDIEVDRTHPLSGALAELRRTSAFDRVLLRGLTAEEVQRMLGTIAGQGVSWGFAEAVHRQTEGNPLFVQEVVRYLAEEGLIQRSGGQWQRVGGTPLEMAIPEGLRDVIGKRLSRLSPQCNRILAIAAVVGRDFDLETLRTVAVVAEEDLLGAIEDAVRVGVLDEQSRPGSIRYRFAHAFFRQTLYEEMIAPRRLRLHQEVGRAIETQYGRRIEEHAAEVAEHFGQSTDPADLAKAVRYGEMAARRAVAVHAYGEAVRHFERALQVLEVLDPDDRERRCDLLLALGEALLPAGEPRRVADVVAEEALALAEALGDNLRAARTCRLAIEALTRLAGGQSQVAPLHRQWARRLLSFAAPGTPERVFAEFQRWGDAWSTGQWTEAWECKEQGLAMARALNDADVLFYAAGSFLGPGLSAARHAARQLEVADEFMPRVRDGVRVGSLANLLNACEWAYMCAGQLDRAETARREQAELAARAHDPIVALWPMLRDIIDATFRGRLSDAIDGAGAFAARAAELGSPVRGRFQAETTSFWPLVYFGRWEEALDTLGGAARMVQLAGTTVRAGRRSLCLAGMGRQEEAREDFHQLWLRLKVSDEEDEMFSAILADLLVSAVTLDDRDSLQVLVRRLQGVTAIAFGAANLVARWLGAAHALLGNQAQARADYERALAWATTVRHRPEIALTRLGMAELLLGNALDPALSQREREQERSEALGHLDFAIEELRAMNMQPALERALRHKGLLHA